MEEVKIPITLDDSGFGTGAKRIIDRMEDTQKEVNKTGMSVDYFAKHMQNVYRHFDKLTAAVHENTAAIGKDSQATRQLGREFDETADKGVNGFGRLEKAAIGFFTIQKAKEFVGKVYDVRSEIEKLETSFRILVGDKAKADALFASIRKFAVETPMQLKDLAGAAQTMMGFGIATEDVMANLEALGNVSMGDSQKFQSLALAFSQMSATGKLMGQDLLQMINAGFNPLDQMAKTTGKSIATLKNEMSEGAISADMVRQAFIDATSEGSKFNGMLEAQSKTMAGAYSNLQGAIDDMLNEIGQKSEGIMKGAIDVTTLLAKNYETVGRVLLQLVATYGTYKAAVMTVTALQGLQTAGIGTLTTAETLHYGRLVLCEKAQKLLNATMLANPYVLAATAVAGLVAVMVTMKTEQERVNEAYDEYIQKKDEAIRKEEEHKARIDELIRMTGDESLSTDTRGKAMVALMQKYPELFQKYATEIEALKDIAYWKAKIAEIESGKSLANTNNELNGVESRIKELEAIRTDWFLNSAGRKTYTGRKRTNKEEAELKALQRRRSELSNQIKKDAGNTYLTNLTGVSNTDLHRQINERRNLLALLEVSGKNLGKVNHGGAVGIYNKEELEGQLKKLEMEQNRRKKVLEDTSKDFVAEATKAYQRERVALKTLESLTDPKKRSASKQVIGGKKVSEMSGDEFLSAIEKQQKAVDEAKKKVDAYDKAKNGSKSDKTAKRTASESAARNAKQLQDQWKHEQEMSDLEDKAARAREDASIAAIQSQAERERAEREAQHRRTVEDLKSQEDDIYKAVYDQRKRAYETANKGKQYEETSEGKAGYLSAEARQSILATATDDEKKLYDTRMQIIKAGLDQENAIWSRSVEDRYKHEAQATLDFLKQYGDYEQQKFAITKEFEEKIRNAASPTEAASLTLQRDNDLEKLSAQQLQEKIDWSGVFNDLDGHSKEYLGKLRDQLQGLLKDGDLPVDQMAVVQGKIQEINAALNKQSGLFGHVSDLQQEHNRRLQQAADAQDRLNRAKQEETAATKRISDVQQKIQDLLSSNGIDTDVDMDDDLARVFDANSEEFKQMNDLLTQLCTNEGELAEARKKTGEATQEAKDAEDAAQESLEQAVARHLGNVNEWTQKYLGDLPGLLDKIGLGDIGEKVQQGMNGINNAANAAADFTSGNFVGAAMNGISALEDFGSMFGLFGSSNHEEMLEVQKEANDKLDLINDKVGRISDKLDKSYGVEAVRTYEELKDYIDSSQEQFHRGVIAAGDDNYDGGHSEWWHRNKNGGEGVDGFVARLKEYYHLDFSGTAWQDFFNYIASLEEGEGARILNDLRENSSMQDIWEELMRTNSYDEGAIAGWVSRWADSYDDMANAIDQLNERLTTTTKENVFDDFLGYLYDFANGVEDVTESAAEDWREMVNRMVINNRIAKDLQESLNGWYDELAQLTKEYAEGGITSEEYARRLSELRKQYDSYMNDAQSQIEQYTEMGIIQPIDKAAERMKELVSDMAGSVRNAFQQLLDGTVTDVERWGRDLRRTMATQLIESLLFDEAFEKWSENMAERFKGITQAFRDGRFDDDTYRRLTGEWSDQVGYKAEDIREQVEDMMKALGLSLSQDDTFRGMGDSWVSMLTDMGIAADDWAEEIGQVMAQRIIQQFVVANMMQPLLDRLQDEFDRASAEEGATWQAIIADENVKAVLDEIKAAYPELQDTVRSIYEALGLSLGEGLGDLTDTFVSSLTNLDGKAGDIGKSVGKKMIEQMIAEIISKKYRDQIEDISRRWQEALDSGDTDAIAALREELEALYQTIGDDDAISQLKEELKELGRSNPFESLRSSFVTSLMDIKSDAQHFASDIGQLLTESFIDRFVLGDEFDKRLAEWQEQYASIMRGNYSEEERARLLKELQAAIAAAKEGYAEEAQAIHDLMGTGNASDQTATANMADKATYEQFETYLGIAVAQQMATLQGNAVREQILSTLRGMNGITSSGGGDTVREIRQLLNTTNEYLLDIRRSNRAILDQFGAKIDNIISKLTRLL